MLLFLIFLHVKDFSQIVDIHCLFNKTTLRKESENGAISPEISISNVGIPSFIGVQKKCNRNMLYIYKSNKDTTSKIVYLEKQLRKDVFLINELIKNNFIVQNVLDTSVTYIISPSQLENTNEFKLINEDLPEFSKLG